MKAIKIMIVIVILSIIGITGFIFIFNKQAEIKEDQLGDAGEEINYDSDELEYVTENIKFYTVNKCVYQYINTLNKQNSSYYGFDENGNYVMILKEEGLKEKIYNLLSKEYIEEHNITIDNVYQYVDNIEEDMFFIPLKMKVISKEIVDKYVVYGILQTMDNKYVKEIYISVNLDKQNQTFSIEPLENYESIDDIKIQNNNQTIESNEENIYEYEKMNYEYVVKNYIDTYKKLALSSPEIAYKFLDEEYRTKRFVNFENYKKYLERNINEIKVLQPNKYLTNQYEEYTEYVVQDKYQNLYIFNEYTPMNFSLKLDTYTIMTEKFKEEYDKSNDQKRIMLNIDKWVQMLNNRDYSAAYAVLDETFRNNKFGSEEKFEQFMREKLPLHYKVEFGEYSNETDIGMQKITFTDITGENLNAITTTIIMQLKDNYEFIMSFEV